MEAKKNPIPGAPDYTELTVSDFTAYVKKLVVTSKNKHVSILIPGENKTFLVKVDKTTSRFFKPFTVKQLHSFVQEQYPLSLTKTQKQPHVMLRFIAAYTAKYSGGYTYREIQHYFGKDHTTWVHACKTCLNLIDTHDPNFIILYQDFLKNFSDFLDKNKYVYFDPKSEGEQAVS